MTFEDLFGAGRGRRRLASPPPRGLLAGCGGSELDVADADRVADAADAALDLVAAACPSPAQDPYRETSSAPGMLHVALMALAAVNVAGRAQPALGIADATRFLVDDAFRGEVVKLGAGALAGDSAVGETFGPQGSFTRMSDLLRATCAAGPLRALGAFDAQRR